MKNRLDWKSTSRLVSRLGQITGFGLSLVTPIFLLVWAALWLMDRFGLGDWVMAAAIVCGLITAGCTFYQFVSVEIRRAARESEAYRNAQAERARQAEKNGSKGGDDHET